jgi:hypothetical protein
MLRASARFWSVNPQVQIPPGRGALRVVLHESPNALTPAHYALFLVLEVTFCGLIMRGLWLLLRRFDDRFSVSLLLAAYVGGSIFALAALFFWVLGME